MSRVDKNKTQGFTLVELLVVMLVLVALSSITLDFTKDFAFQGRYEVTKDRYDKIKRAIIGRPDVLINGQPDISGFVADMGRLPNNIRELLDQNYCSVDSSIDETNSGTAQADCNAITASSWVTQRAYTSASCTNDTYTSQTTCEANSGTWIIIGNGWNGPYLTTSKDFLANNAFSDGWGRAAQAYCSNSITTNPDSCPDNTQADWLSNEYDLNYGWYFSLNTSGSIETLEVLSYGQDQADGGSEAYNVDYPNNITMVDSNDWIVDISTGISVSFKKPQISAINLPALSLCSKPAYSTRSTCEGASPAGVWFGGCGTKGYVNKGSCEDVLANDITNPENSSWYSCSDNTSLDKVSCEGVGAIWFGEGFGCKNHTSVNKTACETAIAGATVDEWRSCSDDGTIDNQAKCEASGHNWYGDKIVHFGCTNRNYTNKVSCEDAGQGNSTWYQCSDNSSANEVTCTQAGAFWLGGGYGCSTQTHLTQGACELANKVWFESWGRCKNITSPSTENFMPYYFTKNNDAACGSSGSWIYAKQKICMKIFYRKESDATIDVLISDADNNATINNPVTILEDGRNQSINFFNFRDSGMTVFDGVPTGINAIGVYEHDGSACTDVLYPSNRTAVQKILISPSNTLSTIDW